MTTRRQVIFYFFLAIVLGSLTYVFYASPLRSKVEDYFYDVRTRLKPALAMVDNITLITIDDKTIAQLEGRQATNLSIQTLLRIVREVQQTQAREIVVLYLSNIFDHESPQNAMLVETVHADPRISIGTLGFNFTDPFFLDFPDQFQPISDRMRGIETFRARSASIVRKLPKYGFRGATRTELLPAYLKRKLTGAPPQPDHTYRVNYRRAHQFYQIKAEGMLNLLDINQYFDDQIVVIGYTAYREWPAQTFDPLLVNTPFKGSADTYRDGESILYLTANAIDNLVNDTKLTEAPIAINVAQIGLVTILLLILWSVGPITGSIATVVAFWLLLMLHAVLYELANFNLPFADTFLFGSFAVVCGTLASLSKELRRYGDIQAKVRAEKDLDKLQSRFLDRFANGVVQMNNNLLEQSRDLANLNDLNESELKLVHACVDSGIEFNDFLAGIQQLASTSGDNKLTNPIVKEFALGDLLRRITARCEQQLTLKDITIDNHVADSLVIRGSAEILDTILYNFISNAVKYSPRASKITVYIEDQPEYLKICVRDQGPGIPSALHERVFEKFYRVKDDSVYRIKGSGIGLYLTRFFAEKIGAKVGLESSSPSGSTFFVALPK